MTASATESFAQFHADNLSNWADMLYDSKGNVSKTVVLWADFFGDVGRGNPTPLIDQQVTLIHEFIHSFFNIAGSSSRGSESGITDKFKVSTKSGQTYSEAVDDWIKHDCGKN